MSPRSPELVRVAFVVVCLLLFGVYSFALARRIPGVVVRCCLLVCLLLVDDVFAVLACSNTREKATGKQRREKQREKHNGRGGHPCRAILEPDIRFLIISYSIQSTLPALPLSLVRHSQRCDTHTLFSSHTYIYTTIASRKTDTPQQDPRPLHTKIIMMFIKFFTIAPLFALAVKAVTVTSPTEGQNWGTTGAQTVSWEAVSTDPTSFSVVLVNDVSGGPSV